MTDTDDEKLNRVLDQLLDGEFISDEEVEGNQLIGQLQQLMHSFRPPKHDFNVNDLIGQSWGDMQVREVIGQGGMGVVYLAYDKVLDRQVALKVLNGFALNYMDSESFVNEARMMAQVRHPHIMAVYGAGIHQGIAGYWGELLTGQTVDAYLANRSKLSERELNDLCIQLAEAVRAIHHKGLVHGDIKSNNVLIEAGRGAVLMDFGTSFDVNDTQASWFRPSTPLAMAPEQFLGEQASQASDVFSLGVLLHLLVTGEYPYSGDSFDELKTAVLKGQRNEYKPHGYHKAYDALIDQMLCYAPEDSPNMQEVITELQRIRQIPLQKARNRVFAISSLALLAITAFSLYLAYSIKQSEQKVLLAKQDTEELNTILTDIIEAPSYVNSGKDVLLKDVIVSKVNEIKNNPNVNVMIKNRVYLSLAHSLATFGERGQQIELLQAIIDSSDKTSQYYKNSLINMADVKTTEQSFDDTERLLAEAEKIKLADSDADRKQNIFLHNTYADYYLEIRDFDKALEHSERAIGLWELRELSVAASETYFIHGQVLRSLFRFDEAIDAYNRCIELALKFRGPDNLHVFTAQMDLAIIHAQKGDFDQSIAMYDQLLPAARKFLGENSNEFFVFKLNFAAILSNAKQFERSLSILQLLLQESDSLAIDRRTTIHIRPSIASNLYWMKEFEKAEGQYREAITEAVNFYPPNHPATMTLYNDLADLYNETGRPQQALDMINQKLPLSLEESGSDHVTNILMDDTRAWSYYLLGKPNKALPLIDSVIERRVRVFGEGDDATIGAMERKKRIQELLSQKD